MLPSTGALEAAMGRAMTLGRTKLERPRRGYSRREAIMLLGAAAATAGSPALAQMAPMGVGGPDTSAPVAPSDGTVEILHGVRVEDPFRPLEDPSRADVQAWIAAQDRQARALLESNPVHGRVLEFLRTSNRYQRSGGMRRVGRSLVSWSFDGTKEQSWLEIREAIGDPGRPLIDPNTMGADGSVSLSGFYPDRFAIKAAYLTAENGGDAQVLRVRDIRSGVDLLDRLEGCRWTSVAWLPDGNSFYYVRPPLPSEPEEWDRSSHHIFHHQLGYPQSADRMIWRFPRRTNVMMTLRRSYATNQLMVSAASGTDEKRGYWVGPLADARLLSMMVPIGLASFWPFRNNIAAHFAATDRDAPRGRIVRVFQGDPRPGSWQTIVPEAADGVIDGATIAGTRCCARFKDLGHQLSIYDLEGKKQSDVEVPGATRVSFERGDGEDPELFLDIDDRLRPARLDRLDLVTGKLETLQASKAPHNLADMQLRQVQRQVQGRHGGSDHADPPPRCGPRRLEPDAALRLRRLRHLAVAVLLEPRRRVGAARRRLCRSPPSAVAASSAAPGTKVGAFPSSRTRSTTLPRQPSGSPPTASRGASASASSAPATAGGLVLTTMLQRPDLIGAVVSGVPVADMVRFPKFTFGVSWTPGIRRSEQARRLQVADGVLAAAQRQAGPELSAADDPDRRQRPARGAGPRLQDGGDAAGDLAGDRGPRPHPARRRPRRRQLPSARPSSTRPISSASCAPSSAARSWSCPRSRRDAPHGGGRSAPAGMSAAAANVTWMGRRAAAL
jgi:prolyl oligopeptidase